MNVVDWIIIGLIAGSATYLFRAAPFALGDGSLLRRPMPVRFATLTSLAVTAGLVSTTLIGDGDPALLSIKGSAVGVALLLAGRFQSALVPLFTGVGLAAAASFLWGLP